MTSRRNRIGFIANQSTIDEGRNISTIKKPEKEPSKKNQNESSNMLVLLILSINKAAIDVAEMKQEEKSQQIKICLKLVKNILDVSPIFDSEIIAAKIEFLNFQYD